MLFHRMIIVKFSTLFVLLQTIKWSTESSASLPSTSASAAIISGAVVRLDVILLGYATHPLVFMDWYILDILRRVQEISFALVQKISKTSFLNLNCIN
jgi:hypothetical protein